MAIEVGFYSSGLVIIWLQIGHRDHNGVQLFRNTSADTPANNSVSIPELSILIHKNCLVIGKGIQC